MRPRLCKALGEKKWDKSRPTQAEPAAQEGGRDEMRCVIGSSGDGLQTDLGELELGVARFQEKEVSQTLCYINKGCWSLESRPNNLARVCTPWVVKSEVSFCIVKRSGVPIPEVLVVCSPDLRTLLVA